MINNWMLIIIITFLLKIEVNDMSHLNWAKRLDPYIWMDEINSKNAADAIKAANALKILKDKDSTYSLIESIENRTKDVRDAYINILTEIRITRKLAPLNEELKNLSKEVQLPRNIFDPLKKYFKEQKSKEEKDLDPEKIKGIETKMNTVQKYIRDNSSTVTNGLREVNPKKDFDKLNISMGREKGAIESFLKDLEDLKNFPEADQIIEELKSFYDNETTFLELIKSIFEILVKMAEGSPIIPFVKKLKSLGNELGNKYAESLTELGDMKFLDKVQNAKKSGDAFNKLMISLLDEIKAIPGKAASVQYQDAIEKNIDNASVIVAIIQALRTICTGNEATRPLMDLLNSLDTGVQRKFLDLIQEQKELLKIKYRNLEHKYDLISSEIFKALGTFKDFSIKDQIIGLLDSKNILLKRRAIKLLADFGDSKTIKDLTRFLNDKDLLVQEYAMIALKQMVPFLKNLPKEEIFNYLNLDHPKK